MGKAERIMGRAFRKAARERMDQEFQLLKKVIKRRPRYVPRFLWQLGLAIFIKKEIISSI